MPEENAPLEEEEPETEEEEVSEETPPPVTREELNDLKNNMSQFQGQVLNALQNKPEPTPQVPSVTPPPEDNADLWKLSQQVPQIMPDLMKKEMEPLLDSVRESMRGEFTEILSRRDTSQSLGERLRHYDDDLRDRDSEILAATPAAKEMLRSMLKPEAVGTADHDKLAYIVAAGSNPGAVSKREVARAKKEEERVSAQRDRASAAGGSGSRGTRATQPKVDAELAERLGINLNDEKERAFLEENIDESDSMINLHSVQED